MVEIKKASIADKQAFRRYERLEASLNGLSLVCLQLSLFSSMLKSLNSLLDMYLASH